MRKIECQTGPHRAAGSVFVIGISDFLRHWTFVIRHSYLSASLESTLVALSTGSQRDNHIDLDCLSSKHEPVARCYLGSFSSRWAACQAKAASTAVLNCRSSG